jgi:hypothetical protein
VGAFLIVVSAQLYEALCVMLIQKEIRRGIMSQNPDTGNWDQTTAEKPKRDQGQNGNRPEVWDDSRARVFGAVGLIALGVIFLLKQYGVDIPLFQNWWALFILIPAIGALWTGFNIYNRAGTWTQEARGAIGGGVIILLIALIFLLDLDWGKVWPLFLIVPGVMLLFGLWGPRDKSRYR